jgi:hypothetical protein
MIFYLIALIAFLVGALLEWNTPRPPGIFWACVGLASWVFVSLWTAFKAI